MSCHFNYHQLLSIDEQETPNVNIDICVETLRNIAILSKHEG
ncbi:hypothetical protein B6N60_01482 [Richelia sinica FACHB-800]|uniref:Uncharacterized protein n=1 Tax=Richelia sinica FACHB-800 TaxID=1357546 RepID=A0A975T7G3_9NOST|nr:hypothetical protein B6N60_01482 [Richelia sinica FACHB-800]